MTLDHRTGWDEAIAAAALRVREECNHSLGNMWCNCEDDAAHIESTPYAAPKAPTPVTHAERVAAVFARDLEWKTIADPEPAPATLRDAITAYAADWAARGTENPGTEIYAEYVAKDLGDLLTKHADAATVARSKVAEAATATADAIANGGDYFPEPIDDGARSVTAEAFRYFASLFEEDQVSINLRDAVDAYAAEWQEIFNRNPGAEIHADQVAEDLRAILNKHSD